MNFWDLSDGTSAVDTGTAFEVGGGEPIPNDTGTISAIEEAKWDGPNEDELSGHAPDEWVELKWRVLKPEAYANRVVFQKVKVFGTSRCKDRTATADKHKRMLMAIDANAGGHLRKVSGKPTDEDLMRCLVGKTMATKVMLWKMTGNDGKERQGNWVSAVAPAKGGGSAAKPSPRPASPPPQQAAPASPPVTDDGYNDDIPF